MSKSIAVIETPKSCLNCRLQADGTKCAVNLRTIDVQLERPDWCPLKDVPAERDEKNHDGSYEGTFNEGWNACLDELLS